MSRQPFRRKEQRFLLCVVLLDSEGSACSVVFVEGPGISVMRQNDSDSCKMFHIQLKVSYSFDRSSCNSGNIFINLECVL